MRPRTEGRPSALRSPVRGRLDRSLATGGALLSIVVIALGIGFAGPASGASHGAGTRPAVVGAAAPAPTTTVSTTPAGAAQGRSVAVSPYTGLAASGAQLTVSGKGFDPSKDLWVAVCAADGVAPAAMIRCIGGAIPDGNETTGWGVVSSASTPPYPGPVLAHWTSGGSFTITLILPAAIGDAVDCVNNPCEVVTRSSDDQDRTEDVTVPVAFTAPPTSPTTPTSAASSSTAPPSTTTPTTTLGPTTSTIGASATTVSPNSILQTSVVAGGSQVVVFTGFKPGESVAVTLFSDPISLPAAKADSAGTVRVEFDVPAGLTPGVHVLQAIGAESRRVGIAQFVVTAAPTTAGTSSTQAPSPTASSAVASSATSSSVVASSETSSAPATTSTPPSPTSAAPTTTPAAGGGSSPNNLLWLWIILGAVILIGAVAGIVAMVRSRKDEDDDLPPLVAASGPEPPRPGWSGGAAAAPGSPVAGYPGDPGNAGPQAGPAHGPGDYGLLSGFEPELLSGRGGPDATTHLIGPPGSQAPTQYLGPGAPGIPAPWPGTAPTQPGGPPTQSGGASTQQWRPEFTEAQPAVPPPARPGADAGGPSTQAWTPDFAGQQPPAQPEDPDGGDGAGGGRHHR
jgi:hypothetical protein